MPKLRKRKQCTNLECTSGKMFEKENGDWECPDCGEYEANTDLDNAAKDILDDKDKK